MSLRPDLRTRFAVDHLLNGGVIAYPTEGVWGLGCDPDDELAVQRVLDLKVRPREKGLILVASHSDQFAGLLQDLPEAQQSRLKLSWPGAVTWLVPHRGRVPQWISGEHDTVALRVSAHPVVRALCDTFGGPIVSTSANRAGAQAPVTAYQVHRYFGDSVDYVVPGSVTEAGRASVIRDLLSDAVIRA